MQGELGRLPWRLWVVCEEQKARERASLLPRRGSRCTSSLAACRASRAAGSCLLPSSRITGMAQANSEPVWLFWSTSCRSAASPHSLVSCPAPPRGRACSCPLHSRLPSSTPAARRTRASTRVCDGRRCTRPTSPAGRKQPRPRPGGAGLGSSALEHTATSRPRQRARRRLDRAARRRQGGRPLENALAAVHAAQPCASRRARGQQHRRAGRDRPRAGRQRLGT